MPAAAKRRNKFLPDRLSPRLTFGAAGHLFALSAGLHVTAPFRSRAVYRCSRASAHACPRNDCQKRRGIQYGDLSGGAWRLVCRLGMEEDASPVARDRARDLDPDLYGTR